MIFPNQNTLTTLKPQWLSSRTTYEIVCKSAKRYLQSCSIRKVAVDFGRMAHYIADLNDPLILSDKDSREQQYRADFAIYLENNLDLFPWIFDGHEPSLLNQPSEEEYLHQIAVNAVQKYPICLVMPIFQMVRTGVVRYF